jgi:hypothetical protein
MTGPPTFKHLDEWWLDLPHLNNTQFEVSKWLLFNSNSAICQLYHGKNKLIFDEMMMRSALY